MTYKSPKELAAEYAAQDLRDALRREAQRVQEQKAREDARLQKVCNQQAIARAAADARALFRR